MPIVSKSWGDGVLGTSATTVATMGGEAGVGLQLRLYNSHGSSVAVTISINTSGTLRPFARLELVASGSALVDLPDLADGDLVSAVAATGSVVHYLVSGGSQT